MNTDQIITLSLGISHRKCPKKMDFDFLEKWHFVHQGNQNKGHFANNPSGRVCFFFIEKFICEN